MLLSVNPYQTLTAVQTVHANTNLNVMQITKNIFRNKNEGIFICNIAVYLNLLRKDVSFRALGYFSPDMQVKEQISQIIFCLLNNLHKYNNLHLEHQLFVFHHGSSSYCHCLHWQKEEIYWLWPLGRVRGPGFSQQQARTVSRTIQICFFQSHLCC